MDLDPHLTTNIPKAFAKPLAVLDHHGNVLLVVTVGWMVVTVVLGLVNAVCIVAVGLVSVYIPSAVHAPV